MTSTDQEQRVLCDLVVQRQHLCYDITMNRTVLAVTSAGKEHNPLMTSQQQEYIDNGPLFIVLCDIMVLFVTSLYENKTLHCGICIIHHIAFLPNSIMQCLKLQYNSV